eukprot:CAMPEP_0119379944 /NCGR_PEP_ID=MMETSP1334-20130426/54800_1 /TAXON_ID=127549 /ORGANISM="Calcidiscus leptoporus, Strain RCC1130" /LENGTH=48 /DNA_ID= /DNA_START= /DNA_END= /DNA_ORIENTATION=
MPSTTTGLYLFSRPRISSADACMEDGAGAAFIGFRADGAFIEACAVAA